MRRVTLQMIADQLNVSKALVSKALANDPVVNAETRENIWNKAEEMGYRFKVSRKQVIASKTKNVVVLLPRAYLDDMEYWGKVIRGIDKELNKEGYSMLLSSVDMSLSPKDGLPASVFEKKVDGAIVMGHLPESYIRALESYQISMVMVDASVWNPNLDNVLAHNYHGAYMAAQALLNAGHRKLAFVGDEDTSWSFKERKRGFEEAIEHYNQQAKHKASYVTVHGIGVTGNGMYTSERLTEDLQRSVTRNQTTALFCANDLCAVEAIKRLAECGVSCPEHVSVIGFDNLSITELMQPKLSTVGVAKSVIGSRAVQMLFKRIENPNFLPELVLISTRLIKRDSVRVLIEE